MYLHGHGPVCFLWILLVFLPIILHSLMLMGLPITALQKSRPWSFLRARVSLFPIADCLYLFSLVGMKTNGIPRCPRQKGCWAPYCCCLQTSKLIPKPCQERDGCFCSSSPCQKLRAHYFELFQKRSLSVDQNAALILAYFQPNDSFVE